METEKITTSPSDNKVYMHTEEEMEAIIEGLVLIEMGHTVLKNTEAECEHLRAFITAAIDIAVDVLIDKLAGEDAAKMLEKIQAKHKEAEALDPMEILKGWN